MPVKLISSRDNPLYRELLALAEDRKARRDSGRTLLDGEHLIDEARRAGLVPSRLVVSEAALAALPNQEGLPVVALTPALFNKLSPVATPSGLLAVIEVPRPARRADARCAMLLEDIQDPGNLGALLRTAAAAEVEEVHLSKGCAEAWSPKALRGGQGGHFRLAIHEGADLVEVARSFPGQVLAAALRRERDLYGLDLSGPTAFAFGNEGAGLSDQLLSVCAPFSIPMAAGVESLNVAAAAAVCLFERLRQLGAAGREA
jgi:TrmH family RNA methyltransferase